MRLLTLLTVASLLFAASNGSIILLKWIDVANAYTDPAAWAKVAVYSIFGGLFPVIGGALKVISMDLYTYLLSKDTTGMGPFIFAFFGIRSGADLVLPMLDYFLNLAGSYIPSLPLVGKLIDIDVTNNIVN